MPTEPQPRIRVAVIGAGIAGLTAALRLLERGYEVAVFEDRINLGGELGAHRGRIPIDIDSVTCEKIKEIIKNIFIDVRRSNAIKESARRVLEQQLDASVVADWVQYIVAEYWKRRREKLKLGPPYAEIVKLVVERTPKDQVPHGAEAEWLVTDVPTRRRFHVAIHLREDRQPQVELSDDVYHEHCYHMFLNWYRNFWELVKEIDKERSKAFTSHDCLSHLFPGVTPIRKRTRTLTRLSGVDTAADNLLSGVASIPDLLLYFYSVADLVSQPLDPARYLDQTSVHAFMRSRWYATEGSARFHEYLLAKAFAVPTFFSSAFAYRKYVEYSVAQPNPMLWVLKGNSYRALFEAFTKKLAAFSNCKLHLGTFVTKLVGNAPDEYKRIVGLKYRPSDMRGWTRNPDDGERPSTREGVPEMNAIFRPDYVVVALPPHALANLLNEEPLRRKVPGLSTVRKLRSGITAALDLYFVRKLDNIPSEHVVLRDSRLGLTFIDNSQCWRDDPKEPKTETGEPLVTHLNVAATDFYAIEGMDKSDATRAIIEDLQRFIPFEASDVDYSRTYLQMNDLEPLFLNEVGSEPWRPGTRTEIPNLFLAGDFCDNEIGIVSVEGAVVTGLLAARAVQAQARKDRASQNKPLPSGSPSLKTIPILLPESYPRLNAEALKLMLMPYLAPAKAWSRLEELARHPERAVSPREMKAMAADVLAAPGATATDWVNYAVEWAQWAAEQSYRDGS